MWWGNLLCRPGAPLQTGVPVLPPSSWLGGTACARATLHPFQGPGGGAVGGRGLVPSGRLRPSSLHRPPLRGGPHFLLNPPGPPGTLAGQDSQGGSVWRQA